MQIAVTMTKMNLCENCQFNTNCSLKTLMSGTILQCEEHLPLPVEKKTKPFSEPLSTDTAFEGLCTNCDFKTNCAIRADQVIVLSCESYK